MDKSFLISVITSIMQKPWITLLRADEEWINEFWADELFHYNKHRFVVTKTWLYEAGRHYSQLNDSVSLLRARQPNFFPSVRIILPLIHITSTTGSERTMLWDDVWWVAVHERTKEKKNKRNIWRHCTIPRLNSEIFKAKSCLKYSEITRKDVILQLYFSLMHLLEKKYTCKHNACYKKHQNKTGNSSRAFN